MASRKNNAPLTEQQKRFCEFYLTHWNATQAARDAGYSRKSAGAQGFRLLGEPVVQEYLASRAQKITDRLEITVENTLREVQRLARSDPARMFNPDGTLKSLHEMEEDDRCAIASIEVIEQYDDTDEDGNRKFSGYLKKIKLWDKNSALDKLMKYLQLYPAQQVNVTGTLRVTGLAELLAEIDGADTGIGPGRDFDQAQEAIH